MIDTIVILLAVQLTAVLRLQIVSNIFMIIKMMIAVASCLPFFS
jgi:hypothetical protein